jgi:choline dehydrogenase-like flavoprotein
MGKEVKRMEADVVVAGGGPGGCTIARELSKRGKRVILVEKGVYSKRFYGSLLAPVRYMEKYGFLFRTVEGDWIVQGKGFGGGTLIYAGSAFVPHPAQWQQYGIDITRYMAEAKKDCWVNKAPPELLGEGSKRLLQSAQDLGYPWEVIDKFVDFEKCKADCPMCPYGCPRGAKWTGMVFAEEAERNGAVLLPKVEIRDVIIENGVAGGVRGKGSDGKEYEISSKVVVCAAGGIGTARILKRSGFDDAGKWFTGDPAIMVFGYFKEGKGGMRDMLFVVGCHDDEHGITFSNVSGPRLFWSLQRFQDKPLRAGNAFFRWGKAIGVMVKISDELEGQIYLDGRVSKPRTKRDISRLEWGATAAEKILVKAGCDPYNIDHSSVIIGHPAATVRVGEMVDSNLETSVKNLYCCDTSVIPDAFGVPPTLVIVSLGKRLSERLETVLEGAPRAERAGETVMPTSSGTN